MTNLDIFRAGTSRTFFVIHAGAKELIHGFMNLSLTNLYHIYEVLSYFFIADCAA